MRGAARCTRGATGSRASPAWKSCWGRPCARSTTCCARRRTWRRPSRATARCGIGRRSRRRAGRSRRGTRVCRGPRRCSGWQTWRRTRGESRSRRTGSRSTCVRQARSGGQRRMADEVVIRTAREADVPHIIAIERQAYSMPWTESTFRGLIERADADVLAADAGGRLVGYAACWVVVDQAELGNIAVAPEWRRLGVGTRLLEAAIERSRERGVRELFLEVRVSNTAAQRLYQ